LEEGEGEREEELVGKRLGGVLGVVSIRVRGSGDFLLSPVLEASWGP
jgi:hypothetical protein